MMDDSFECPACGTDNPAGRKFCTSCGTVLSVPPPDSAAVGAGPKAGDRADWPLVAGLLVAVILAGVGVGYVASTLIGGNSGSGASHSQSGQGTASESAGAESRAPSGIPTVAPAPEPPIRPATLPLETVYTNDLIVKIPKGWYWDTVDEQNETDSGEPRITNVWRDPADPDSSLLIDTSPASDIPVVNSAASVRAATSQDPDYQEIDFREIILAGRPAAQWIFDLSDDRRVDYFFNECSQGFAVLGVAPQSRFVSLAPTFRRIASSVSSYCD